MRAAIFVLVLVAAVTSSLFTTTKACPGNNGGSSSEIVRTSLPEDQFTTAWASNLLREIMAGARGEGLSGEAGEAGELKPELLEPKQHSTSRQLEEAVTALENIDRLEDLLLSDEQLLQEDVLPNVTKGRLRRLSEVRIRQAPSRAAETTTPNAVPSSSGSSRSVNSDLEDGAAEEVASPLRAMESPPDVTELANEEAKPEDGEKPSSEDGEKPPPEEGEKPPPPPEGEDSEAAAQSLMMSKRADDEGKGDGEGMADSQKPHGTEELLKALKNLKAPPEMPEAGPQPEIGAPLPLLNMDDQKPEGDKKGNGEEAAADESKTPEEGDTPPEKAVRLLASLLSDAAAAASF